MNKGSSKDYKLLIQDEQQPGMSRYEDHPASHSQMEIDEDSTGMDDETPYDSNDSDDSDESYIQISKHRTLSNENLLPKNGNAYKQLGNLRKETAQDDTPSTAIWTPTPMSPARRAGFLATIMFGILMGALFLWALPCNVQDCSCSGNKPTRWTTELDSVVVSYMKILQLEYGSPYVLIGYQGGEIIDETFPLALSNSSEELNTTEHNCGLLLLSGGSGHEIWNAKIDLCPINIICSYIDITGDGFHECLVLGNNSYPVMLDPSHGTILWTVQPPSTLNSQTFNFSDPIFLNDIDGDNHLEMLFAVTADCEDPNILLIISGKTGVQIGDTTVIENCHGSTVLSSINGDLEYTCSTEDGMMTNGTIPMEVLTEKILSQNEFSIDNNTSLMQPVTDLFMGPLSSIDDDCLFNYVNIGSCPSCTAELHHSSENLEIMENTQIVFLEEIKFWNQCKGVLLKLWKYKDMDDSINKSSKNVLNETHPPILREFIIEESIKFVGYNNATSSIVSTVLDSLKIKQSCNVDCFPLPQMERNSIAISYASIQENFLVLYVSSTTIRETTEDGIAIGTPVSLIRKIVHHLHPSRPWLHD